jgi:hypothetical protein
MLVRIGVAITLVPDEVITRNHPHCHAPDPVLVEIVRHQRIDIGKLRA